MEAEISKRVYQGVRVKHTVKDLLAEKRSRQASGPRFTGISSPQNSFVQMAGSHMIPGYYGMRRSFISDAEFSPSSKQSTTDIYSSALIGKPISWDTTSTSNYSSLIDTYYQEPFSDYRSTALSGGASAIFSSSALSTLLPPFPGDTSHFVLRDSWEQAGTEVVDGLCGEGLVPAPMAMPVNGPLAGSEPSSPSQYRSSSRNTSVPSSQAYSLHSLEDVHYQSSFQPSNASFSCPSYMTTSSESTGKIPSLLTVETEIATPTLNDTLSWAKEDASVTWPQYELRRAF